LSDIAKQTMHKQVAKLMGELQDPLSIEHLAKLAEESSSLQCRE
jgi:hypothetical protein